MEKITVVGMATIPERRDTLELVISSLARQADRIELALNDFNEVPLFLQKYPAVHCHLTSNVMGDANKFLNVDKFPNAYYFSCDDDIIYPGNYVSKYIREIKKNRSLITIHGSNIIGKIYSYYRDKQMKAHCLTKSREVRVHIPGSGVSAFDTTQFKVKYKDFKKANMADIFLAIQAQEQGIKCISIFHKKGWIKGGLNNGRATIYEDHKNSDKVQTDLVNARTWK